MKNLLYNYILLLHLRFDNIFFSAGAPSLAIIERTVADRFRILLLLSFQGMPALPYLPNKVNKLF